MTQSAQTRSENRIAESADCDKSTPWISRSILPAKTLKTDFNVWSFVKQCIGKDLTRISMPVALNEPLSFLQRVAEYMEYSDLLVKACEQTDPICRMEYVVAFAVSATSSNHNRLKKPFNPLLGETYELRHNGFVLIAEQVSHHPPISAVHVVSNDYSLWSTVQFKLRFWGKSLEVQPKGYVTLKLHKHQETYTWQYPNLMVNNVLLGKLSLEFVGQMCVTNHTTGFQGQIEFHQSSWFVPQANQITGQLFNKQGTPIRQFFGNWTRGLFSIEPHLWQNRQATGFVVNDLTGTTIKTNSSGSALNDEANPCGSPSENESSGPQLGFELPLPEQRCLWLATPRPVNTEEYYNFTRYAIGLNDLVSDSHNGVASSTSGSLPPTDSRFRPDIRALELGQMEIAATEKDRLEEKQRRAIKRSLHAQKSKLGHHTENDPNVSPSSQGYGPLWFHQSTNPWTQQQEWLFNNQYLARDWSRCPDLY